MSKVATISRDVLIRKGMAQPMAANAPLLRASAPAAIDCQALAHSPAPLTLATAPAPRQRNGDGRAHGQAEPRVRLSLRLDRQRYTKFRSFCALVRRTQQSVLVQALDEFFARHGLDEAAGDRRRPLPE